MPQTYKLQGLCVDVDVLSAGMMSNNIYIVSDGSGTFVVDPGSGADKIVEMLKGRHLDAIVLTHHHWDHVDACAQLKEMTGAQVMCGQEDASLVENPRQTGTSRVAKPCIVDRRLKGGDVIHIGNMEWKVIETPGHTLGSICLFTIPQYGNHQDGVPVLISGDTLFAGTTGRTDFEGGSSADMAASMKKLAALPDDTVVLPGHDSFTTIARSRPTFARFA